MTGLDIITGQPQDEGAAASESCWGLASDSRRILRLL